METKLYIGGKFVLGAGESEEILNPATGKLIARIPSASQEQIDQAVAAATRAFLDWALTTPGQRSGMLLKLADKIEAEAEDFARQCNAASRSSSPSMGRLQPPHGAARRTIRAQGN